MDIGQHFLEGNIVELIKPFLVVEKFASENVDANDSLKTSQDIITKDLEIQGIVTKKIIFAARPKPIAAKKNKWL